MKISSLRAHNFERYLSARDTAPPLDSHLQKASARRVSNESIAIRLPVIFVRTLMLLCLGEETTTPRVCGQYDCSEVSRDYRFLQGVKGISY